MNKFYKGYDDITASDIFKSCMVRTLQNESRAEAVSAGRQRIRIGRFAALVAAAILVLALGTVFAIPSARAEVLGWFGISTPRDYLAIDESERANSDLNTLISSPDANGDGIETIPIDRTDSEAVNGKTALDVSEFLYENADVTLGDALFDGETIHQSIRLKGLSGLYLLEAWVGGDVTAIPVDPAAVTGLYEEIEPEYLTGEKILYERPESWIMYEMPDGTRFGSMVELAGAVDPSGSVEQYAISLREKGIKSTDTEAINAENAKFLAENDLVAVSSFALRNRDKYADENGRLTAKVYYVIKVIEEERAGEAPVPDTELFTAELGTITIDLNAPKNLEQSGFAAEGKVVWGAETVTVSREEVLYNADWTAADQLSFIKHRVSMEGVTMQAETETAAIDALGVKNLAIRVTLPDSWTAQEREALAESLEFEILIDGERGDWYAQYVHCAVEADGTILWAADHLEALPYDRIRSIRTISFVPAIRASETIEMQDRDGNVIETLNPAYGETVLSKHGFWSWNPNAKAIEYPAYAVTIRVK